VGNCPLPQKRWVNILKFFSKVTRKPNAIIEEVRHGTKLIEQKCICTFINGVLETDDPKIIKKLEERKDLFRTDRPWKSNHWEDTEEGQELLKKGEALNIDIRHIRKESLIRQIDEKEGKTVELKPKVKTKLLQYKELLEKAKALNIETHKRKKEDILKDIKEKEVK